jgi:hypothetical protein
VLTGADFNAVIRKVINAAVLVKIFQKLSPREEKTIAAASATTAASHRRQMIILLFSV